VTRRRAAREGPAHRRARSPGVRLQKFLSDAGVASRRRAEELIRAGRVLVNDEVTDMLPAFVDPAQDRVVVDGTCVRPQRLEYFLVHKPKGVVCTNSDPAGRVRAIDLLPELPVRLFPVGRLDAESTGLLLLTNDGELAERITHPRYGIPKTYYAEVRGRVPRDLPAHMRAGVYLAEGKARASGVKIVHSGSDRSALLITLREGRNRQVRRMLVRLGHPVRKLKRVQIGPLTLHGLPVGSARRLTPKELAQLRAATAHLPAAARAKRRRSAEPKKEPLTAPAARRAAPRAARRLIT
jgi:23S rRNA pseudouridine2605 synthase